VRVRVVGYPCRPIMEWATSDAPVVSLWQQELAERGVLCHPSGWNPSAVHTDADIEQTLDACGSALTVVMGAIDRGTVRESLRGEPIQSAFVERGR